MSNTTFNQLVAGAQADVEAGRPPDYSKLFADAEADLNSKHPCRMTSACITGCPKCVAATMRMRGDVDSGVSRIDVFPELGVVHLTMTESHDGVTPCFVSFRGVPVHVRKGRTL
jgi:hypothetical protein